MAQVIVTCRNCKTTFESRNRLHVHLREIKCLPRKPAVNPKCKQPETAVKQNPPSAYSAEAPDPPIPVAIFTETPKGNIGTGYSFRNWHYVTAKVKLSATATPEPICLDTGCSVTLIDKDFLLSQSPDIEIRTMSSPITVRGIGSSKHLTAEYVVTPILFTGERDGKPMEARFMREAHIVQGLKAKMLLGIDVMGPEKFEMSLATKKLHIGSYNVDVQISLKPRGRHVQQVVSAISSTVIPPQSQATIQVHHAMLSFGRDFLFEPDDREYGLTLYAHIVDAGLFFIMAKNETEKPLRIPRNFRLGKIAEMHFDGCYHANAEYEDLMDLAARRPRSAHKSSWIRRAFVAATAIAAAISPVGKKLAVPNLPAAQQADTIDCHAAEATMETVMPNGVTIHGDSKTAEALKAVVDEYASL